MMRHQLVSCARCVFKYSLGLLIFLVMAKHVRAAVEEIDIHDEKITKRYQVAHFNFEEVSSVYAITLWILLGSLAKIAFHLSHKLTEIMPESCLLVILGLIVGALFYATKLADERAYVLNSNTFFLFLLPPIILEAGYFMPNRPFFDNLGTILLFAIVNTLFNTITIGLTLWGFNFTPLYGGVDFELLPCFVFAALISAVDPVAVLATFVEIHVNDTLYILVFGESLLNDGVSVVLYRLFDGLAEIGSENIIVVDIVLGAASFFVVAVGGVLIGLVFGFIASITTKYTEKAPILEPLIIITISYLSYLTAEMTSTSSILAITFCGMFMKQYVEFNMSKKSTATVEYILKMAASIMETIIFMFMGLSTISDNLSWNTGFVFISIITCAVYRFFGVLIFANLANRNRLQKLEITDMLIMSYGGIRGAVAFALALILEEDRIERKKEFLTAAIAVIFFTIFIQGTTIGPLVTYLKIKKKEIEEPTMSAKLTNRLIDHLMSGFEAITGVAGKNTLRDKARNFDRNYIKPLLLREVTSKDQKLLETFRKINEFKMAEMANNPQFVFNSRGGGGSGGGDGGGGGGGSDDPNKDPNGTVPSDSEQPRIVMPTASISSKIKQRRATIFAHKPMTIADQYRDLLDNAMYTPRRRGTMFNRIQLEDDDEDEDNIDPSSRRRSRSASYFRAAPRKSISEAAHGHNARQRKKSVVSQVSQFSDDRETTAKHVPKPKVTKQNDDDNSHGGRENNSNNNNNNNNPTGVAGSSGVKHPFVHFSDENFTLKAKSTSDDNDSNQDDRARQQNQQPAPAAVSAQIGDDDLNEQVELQF